MERGIRRSFKFNSAGDVREEKWNGRDYLVAPVVAIVEGVLNKELVRYNQFCRFAETWNAVPVTIWHPTVNGKFVSARHQAMFQNSVGFYFNADCSEEPKLKGEVWIDIEKCNEQGGDAQRALEMARDGKLEVSTGYICDVDLTKTGTFNGKEYRGEQFNHRPDHLALLPGGRGACSWEDGCGLPRANQDDEPKGFWRRLTDRFLELFKNDQVKVNGTKLAGVLNKMVDDQVTDDRSREQIVSVMAEFAGVTTAKVDQILGGEVDFLTDTWIRGFSRALDVDTSFLFRAIFSDQEDFFFQVNRSISNNPKEPTMDKAKLIQQLIDNEAVGFTKDDTDYLKGLSVERLQAFLPTDTDTEPPKGNKADDPARKDPKADKGAKANADTDCGCDKKKGNTADDTDDAAEPAAEPKIEGADAVKAMADELGVSPGELKDFVQQSVKTTAQQREQLVKVITANSEFSDDDLKLYSTEHLQKLAHMAAPASYVGRIAPRNQDGDDAAPVPNVVDFIRDNYDKPQKAAS